VNHRLLGLSTVALVLSCAPPDTQGACDVDPDCTGRGEVCNMVARTCEFETAEHDSSQPGFSGDFADKQIPFFRGRVCVPKNRASVNGQAIPITYNPCFHPCVNPGTNHVFTKWQCDGSNCGSKLLYWTEGASGTACPADVFGKFNPDQCDYSTIFDGSLGPINVDGNPLNALVQLEVPFLTNADLEAINEADQNGTASGECIAECAGDPDQSSCLKGCTIDEKVRLYAQEPDRVFYHILDSANATPPEACSDGGGNLDLANCECIDIGFDD
jgi:hypothetical protein